MTKDNIPRQSRSTTHFKFYSEKYLWGSTKSELLPCERSVWVDFLSLASLNYGVVECFSRDQLAKQLVIERELLDRSIEKFKKFGKIKRKFSKREKKEIFSITKWDRYQADYLKKRVKESSTYREKNRSDKTEESAAENHPILKEKRGEEIKLEDNTSEENRESDSLNPKAQDFNHPDQSSPLPSNPKPTIDKEMTMKGEFLSLLRNCKGYPFDELKDSILFDVIFKECPGINIIKQTEKKIDWWRKHPDALKADPRSKLYEWCKEEAEFQKRGGPQKIGEIMKEVDDPDHRKFLGNFFKRIE